MTTISKNYKQKIPKWDKETLQSLLTKQRAKKDIALSLLLSKAIKAKKD